MNSYTPPPRPAARRGTTRFESDKFQSGDFKSGNFKSGNFKSGNFKSGSSEDTDEDMQRHNPIVVITSIVPDALNSNAAIRGYAADGMRTAFPGATIREVPLEIAHRVIREIRPHLVLAIGGLATDGNALRDLRQAADAARAPLALWLHDDPYEFDYAFRGEAVADVIFTNDLWASFHYRHPKVHHLPLAACRTTYFRPITSIEREIEVFFCGHAHPNRIRFFRNAAEILGRYGMVLNGTGWPADIRAARNRRMSPREVADAAQCAQMTLNLSRELNIANRRFDLPASTPGPRTFEIALAGSAQLYWVAGLEIADYLKPGSEIVLLDGTADLARALERGRDEPEYYLAVARAAQARVLNAHCYEHRMARLWQLVFPDGHDAAKPGDAAETPRTRMFKPMEFEVTP